MEDNLLEFKTTVSTEFLNTLLFINKTPLDIRLEKYSGINIKDLSKSIETHNTIFKTKYWIRPNKK